LSLLLTRTPLRVRYRSDFNSYCRWQRRRWWSRACCPFSVLPFRRAVCRVLSILCGDTWSLVTQWQDIVLFRCCRNAGRLRCFHSEQRRVITASGIKSLFNEHTPHALNSLTPVLRVAALPHASAEFSKCQLRYTASGIPSPCAANLNENILQRFKEESTERRSRSCVLRGGRHGKWMLSLQKTSLIHCGNESSDHPGGE